MHSLKTIKRDDEIRFCRRFPDSAENLLHKNLRYYDNQKSQNHELIRVNHRRQLRNPILENSLWLSGWCYISLLHKCYVR